jgi:hypothetical protein
MMLRGALMPKLVFVLAIGVSGCGLLESEAGEPIAGNCENEDSEPDVDVSFRDQIQPKLHMGCGCHNPIPPSTGGSIDSTGFSVGDYAAIRRGGSNSRDKIVVPGDPCGSFLYQKLSDAPPVGNRMPSNGPYWSRGDMTLLHDWIAEGARAD